MKTEVDVFFSPDRHHCNLFLFPHFLPVLLALRYSADTTDDCDGTDTVRMMALSSATLDEAEFGIAESLTQLISGGLCGPSTLRPSLQRKASSRTSSEGSTSASYTSKLSKYDQGPSDDEPYYSTGSSSSGGGGAINGIHINVDKIMTASSSSAKRSNPDSSSSSSSMGMTKNNHNNRYTTTHPTIQPLSFLISDHDLHL